MSDTNTYKVSGAGCGACILKIRNLVAPVAGVITAEFDLKHNILTVTGKHDKDEVIAVMQSAKFATQLITEGGATTTP